MNWIFLIRGWKPLPQYEQRFIFCGIPIQRERI